MEEKTNNNETITKIKEILETLRPYLNMDGGDVEFIEYKENIVYVKLTGACAACMFSDDTIKNGLYETLKSEIPEIEGVINITV
jgi:Fe-S cluster biogenesis protein NfuA